MTAESIGRGPAHSRRNVRASLDALARRKGARPVSSVHDLASPGVFETDVELDEFLTHVRAERAANLA